MRTFVQLGLLGALWASTAFGLTSNCPTATSSAPGYTIAASGSNTASADDALSSLNTAYNPGDANYAGAVGCGYIDKVFTNFTVTQTLEGSLGRGSNLGPQGTYAFFSGGDTINFSDIRGTAVSNGDTNNNDKNRNFIDALAGANSVTVTYVISIGSGVAKELTSINFFVNGVSLGTGAAATMDGSVCMSTSAIIGGVCSGTTISISQVNLANFTSASLDLAAGTTSILVTQTFTLNAGTGPAGFQTFGATITETPEPSTFGMMSAALGALGYLARRRRRAAKA